MFAVWDVCAGDGDEKWQQVVEYFIRDRMPSSSELGYSSELLARLNRSRSSLRDFAPYRDRRPVDERFEGSDDEEPEP